MANFLKPRRAGTRLQVAGRLSYAHLFEPRAINNSDDKKYSVVLLVPKADTESVNAIKEAIQEAKVDGLKVKWGDKLPRNYRQPLKDGDELNEDGERVCNDEYKDCYYFNATSKVPVGILNQYKQHVTDRSEVYSGCYAWLSVGFFAYANTASNGISAGLNGVMKIRDGEPLGGKKDVFDDFDFIEPADVNGLGDL